MQKEKTGTVKLDEDFIWGLSDVFKELNVSIGTRIELAFNTWNRTLSIVRVDGNETSGIE
jgi:hypothetical protein